MRSCFYSYNGWFFSGRFDAFHLVLGAIACLFIAYTSRKLVFRQKKHSFVQNGRKFFRIPLYLVWLIYQIVKANFCLLRLVFHPKMHDLVEPRIVTLDGSKLDSDFARVVLAHSITLTPGTITLALESKVLKIYAINKSFTEGLEDMLEKVSWTFNFGQSSNA